MTLGRGSARRMDLAAFRMKEIEVDHLDADGRPVFRHRSGLRALLARLRTSWADHARRANAEHTRPTDRA